MPISPEDRSRYPDNWQEISRGIRVFRARGRCECWGDCGVNHDGRCPERDGEIATWNTDREIPVVLTVAHLDHQPENNRSKNLRAMCQRCHLAHDQDHHRATRARHQQEALEDGGQLSLERLEGEDDETTGCDHGAELGAEPRASATERTAREETATRGQGRQGAAVSALPGGLSGPRRGVVHGLRPGTARAVEPAASVLEQVTAEAWGQLRIPDAPGQPIPPGLDQVRSSPTYRRALKAASTFRGGRPAWKELKRLYLPAFQIADAHGALKDALAHAIAPEGSLWQQGRGRARWQVVRFDQGARQLTVRSDGQPSRTRLVRLPQLFGKDSRWRRVQ